MRQLLAILFIIISSAGCLSQKQGISGRVVWISGNQMPGPDRQKTPENGVKREIVIYNPLTLQQVKRNEGLYSEINAVPVAKVTSNEDGAFTVNLPPGEYSVLTKEDDGYFANILDGQGRINVISVKKNEFSEIKLEINYQAAY